MNLEEQIANELSEQMHSAIDFEILSDMLVKSCGWHRVDIDRFTDNHHAIDITHWCHDNVRGEWKRNGSKFIFKESSDAVMFTLRWKC